MKRTVIIKCRFFFRLALKVVMRAIVSIIYHNQMRAKNRVLSCESEKVFYWIIISVENVINE